MYRGHYHHGFHRHGRMGFSPFFPLMAIFALFFIFKSGLFLPLMLIGFAFWMFRRHGGYIGFNSPPHRFKHDFHTYDYKQKYDDSEFI